MTGNPHGPPDGGFYVGYQPRMPATLARFLRYRIVALMGLGAGLALALALGHQAPVPAMYEYGTVREFSGMIVGGDFPALALDPGPDDAPGPVRLLAGPGKRGAAALVAHLDGSRVTIGGTVLRRGDQIMLEVHSVTSRPGPAQAPAVHDHGDVTLTGEVVDAKCHLGAMNPGQGPTHRACAARCLRGGLPALLATRDADGRERAVLLTGPGGRSLHADLVQYVAARVSLRGRHRQVGTMETLEADPTTVRRERP